MREFVPGQIHIPYPVCFLPVLFVKMQLMISSSQRCLSDISVTNYLMLFKGI